MIQYTMFLRRKSFFHALDPRTKLAFTFVMFSVSMMYKDIRVLLLIFLLNIIVLLLLCKIGIGIILKRTRPLLPLLIMSVALWPFFDTTGRILFSWRFLHIATGGILLGGAMAFRILTVFLSTYILLFTTEQKDLVSGFVKLGMGYEYGLTIAIAFRYIPTIAGVAFTIMDAQKARGLELERGSLFEKIKKYIPILTPLIISSIKMSSELAIAIESRSFGKGKRTTLHELTMGVKDYLTLALSVLFLAFFVKVRYF